MLNSLDNIKNQLNQNKGLVHASNIKSKADNLGDNPNGVRETKLRNLIEKYNTYLSVQLSIKDNVANYNSLNQEERDYIDDNIEKRVNLLNAYYDDFEKLGIEGKGDECYDSRSKIRSTILEEFMYLLFMEFVKTLIGNNKKTILKNGSAKAYSNLYFTASDVNEFIKDPTIKINTKNQDYAIYREVEIMVKGSSKKPAKTAVPILAIENKTFLDKTMLEGTIATAEKIKMGAPYSVFIAVTETYAVDNSVDPVYSRIDQIFVLRKCGRDENKPIDAEVVKNMFWYVVERMLRPWSKVDEKLKQGFII